MAALTHVCVWSRNGWKRITPEEVAREHSLGGVSARSGIFMCSLCGQYVTFFNGRVQTPHFRHSSAEADKSCPQRMIAHGYDYTYVAGEHELPIRMVNVTDHSFEFELGLLAVPRAILKQQEKKSVTIIPLDKSITPFVYSFERLNVESITYVPIGEHPCESYAVVSSDEIEKTYWPRVVGGIKRGGSVFDRETGRMLTDDADVIVGKTYYLLSASRPYDIYNGISIKSLLKKSVSWTTWYLSEVFATDFTESAAKFFLNYHCRLTSEPISIQPIWPIYVQSPYIIQNSGETTWFHIRGQGVQSQGEIVTKTYPTAPMLYYTSDEGKVCSVEINERQQLISTGRAKVLEYTYLWKKQLKERSTKPIVSITDVNENALKGGLENELPANHIMRILAPFDGVVQIKKNGHVIEKILLKAENVIEYSNVQYGMEISVLQGLDIIWSIAYQRLNRKSSSSDDLQVVHELMSSHGAKVPISHTLGATLSLLKNYPETKKWISQKIRSGYIEESAFVYYKHFIGLLKTEGKGKR